MSTTQDVNELRAEIGDLKTKLREAHRQRIEAETYARAALKETAT